MALGICLFLFLVPTVYEEILKNRKKLNSVSYLDQGEIFQAIQFSCVVSKFRSLNNIKL